jgi:hypothetical protein
VVYQGQRSCFQHSLRKHPFYLELSTPASLFLLIIFLAQDLVAVPDPKSPVASLNLKDEAEEIECL